MKILAIESSCDETAAAVISEDNGKPLILSNIIASQIKLHSKYGGVVPEVAARAHIESIIPVIKKALKDAGQSIYNIDYLAVTKGPGLIGSLIVGVETAKALSVAKKITLVPVNHLEGHIYAAFSGCVTDGESQIAKPDLKFPILTLLVSGGNTLLILMKDHLSYKVVGQTLDDAAGEAFDKGAKILGLGYPGGPLISERAEKGIPNRYQLPIIDLTPPPKRDENGFLRKPDPSLDFSFSGLKTALLNLAKSKTALSNECVNDLSSSYQNAIVDTLVQNSLRAISKYQPKTFVLAGGVAANKLLRVRLQQDIKKSFPDTRYLVPKISLCGDNAAMIGVAAYYHITKNKNVGAKGGTILATPNLKIGESA
jgi:N6-L-threonylcarbamoyladenine synthase